MLSEFKVGIFNLLKKIVADSSIKLAVIYTIGHIIIAMTIVRIMTGASLWEAGAVALIEPTINGFWFYALHKVWQNYQKN